MDDLLVTLRNKTAALRRDAKLMSGIYAVILVTALLILALAVRGPEESGKLIADGSGAIVGISRRSLQKTERYDLDLEIRDGEEITKREVTLTLQPQSDGRTGIRISSKDDRQASIDAGIDSIISEIEYSKDRKISLPHTLPDGTAIRWLGADRSDNSLLVLIPVIYAALILMMIASSGRGDKSAEERRRSILKGLPRFCNQLFLMMNAGLILSDAFDTITGSYASYEEDDLSSFEKDLAAMRDATDGHRISTADVIKDYALRNDVKEMIRIASILTENERRGSDVIESLARESRYLWDERKIVARESGKMIDTKMAYPLGLLLILLIVITMAPALLGM